MKYLIILLLLSTPLSWAHYQKPQLLALFFSTRNWGLEQDSYCHLGTPVVFGEKRILNCQRGEKHELILWDKSDKPSLFFSSKNFISIPQSFGTTLTWYEYDMEGIIKIHQWEDGVYSELPLNVHARAVSYLGDKWIYQSRENLYLYTHGEMKAMGIDDLAYVFSPAVSSGGDFAVKVRRQSLANSSPDEIWSLKKNKWIKVFSDKDSDPDSPWLSFNNSLAAGDGKVFVIAQSKKGEALVEVSHGQERILAREGREVKSFESFSIAYNKGSVVFRAIDHQNRKVIYVHDGENLKRVLTQGDTILLPNGIIGQVDYPNAHSIIYNNPAIGENGEVIIQATLLDFEDKKTLIGVGVLSIKKDVL